MHVKIRNLMGVDAAEFTIAPKGITLLAGPNEAGKSTILAFTAAALCGVAQPIKATKAEIAKHYVRHGAKTGSVTVTDAGGSVSITYPDAQSSSKGDRPPSSPPAAVGRSDLTQLSTEQRAATLSEILKVAPTAADIRRALLDREITDDQQPPAGKVEPNLLDWPVATAVALFEEFGAAETVAMCEKEAAGFKKVWSAATGRAWGAKVADGWRPEGWDEALEELDEGELQGAVEDAQRALDEAIGTAAVADSERARLQALADELDARQKAVEAADAARREAGNAEIKAKAARDALPSTEVDPGQPCPHCGKPVVGRFDRSTGPTAYRLEAPAEGVTGEALKERREAYAAADGAFSKAAAERLTADRHFGEAQRALSAAREAKAALDKMADAPQAAAGTVSVEDLRAKLGAATADLAMWRKTAQAHDAQTQISRALAIADILSPDGIAKTKLVEAMVVLNGQLHELCAVAGWPPVTIDQDLDILFGGVPYGMMFDGSMTWRARAVIRVLLAKLRGSPIVILDAPDALDDDNKASLVAMLEAAGVVALVAMAFADPTYVPDLAVSEQGITYWVERGTVAPLAAKLKAAA